MGEVSLYGGSASDLKDHQDPVRLRWEFENLKDSEHQPDYRHSRLRTQNTAP